MILNQTTTPSADKVTVRIAQSPQEIAAAQRLRYKVFYEEYNAVADEETLRTRMDVDEFDTIADHLIVVDLSLPEGIEQIVGTYRLLRRDVAEKFGKFYTSGEFDIQPMLNSYKNVLELGRSCVLPPYRTSPILQKLWQGIAQYISKYDIDLMFGCGSLYGTDTQALASQLSYLYHHHLAKPEVCPIARPERYVEMNILPKEQLDIKRVFMGLPPLIKGYLRIGCSIGNGAVIDHQWNSTDVCIVMPTKVLAEKYVKHYYRKDNTLEELEKDLAAQQMATETTVQVE
jgi:L-ornithine Nalpha-acyltransferase